MPTKDITTQPVIDPVLIKNTARQALGEGASGLPSQLGTGTQITITAASILDDKGAVVNLSIIYQEMLGILVSKRIAKINATVKNIEQMRAGIAIYEVILRNISRNYTAGTAAFDGVNKRTVSVPLDLRKEIAITYESLDLEQLGATFEEGKAIVSGVLLGGWLRAKAVAFESYLYAKLLKLGVATAAANTTYPVKVIEIDLTTAGTVDQLAKYRFAFRELNNYLQDLKNKITTEYVGIDPEDGILWVSPLTLTDLLLMTTNLGDSGEKKLEQGNDRVIEIGGLKIIEAPFLGNNYAAGVLDKEEAFDFRGPVADKPINMIWVHKEALAFPTNKGVEQVMPNFQNANIYNLHKFMVNSGGGVAIRPELCIGFTLIVKTA